MQHRTLLFVLFLAACGDASPDAVDGASGARSSSLLGPEVALTALIAQPLAVKAPVAERAPVAREVVLTAPWGAGLGELGRLRPDEGNPECPMSFDIDRDGALHVLDQVNHRIQVFEGGAARATIPLPNGLAQDIDVDDAGRTFLLDRLGQEAVLVLGPDGRPERFLPLLGRGIPVAGGVTALFARPDGVWVEVGHTSLVRIADPSGTPVTERTIADGRLSEDGKSWIRLAIAGPRSASLEVAPAGGDMQVQGTRLLFPLPVWSLHAMDTDREGRIYVTAYLVQESDRAPIRVLQEREQVVVLDPSARELGRVELTPPVGPEEQLRPVRVALDGSIYQLLCHEDHASIGRVVP